MNKYEVKGLEDTILELTLELDEYKASFIKQDGFKYPALAECAKNRIIRNQLKLHEAITALSLSKKKSDD